MTKKKTNTVILPRTCLIECGSKTFHKDLSVRLERVGFDVGKSVSSEKMSALPNKSIKELKAENASWQSCSTMFIKAESRMKKLNV